MQMHTSCAHIKDQDVSWYNGVWADHGLGIVAHHDQDAYGSHLQSSLPHHVREEPAQNFQVISVDNLLQLTHWRSTCSAIHPWSLLSTQAILIFCSG